MPTYDYECDACGHRFEKYQSITAKPVRKCPACGRAKVRRLIGSGAGILFKGSGFYQTDYRSESYRKAAEKDKPPGTGKSDAAAGKSDAAAGKSDSAKGKSDSGSGKSDSGAAKPDSAAGKSDSGGAKPAKDD